MNADLLPKISILIAVRNEADTILDCLISIQQIDYPKEKIEVLLGNDQSTDTTLEVMQAFVNKRENYQVFDITQRIGNQKGKANVLAQLAKQAKGEIYFFTDADVVLSKNSLHPIEQFLKKPKLGIIGGFTLVENQGFFSALQCLEWLEAISLIKIATDCKIPVTAMGNNMFVRAEAYKKTGGYEKMNFSLIEDFALFHRIVKEGYQFQQIFQKNIFSLTQACGSLEELLQQRKRWMKGALQLPWWVQTPLWMTALIFPLCTLGFMTFAMITTYFLIIFVIGHVFYMFLMIQRIKGWYLLPFLFPYVWYKILMTFVFLLYYFLPFSIQWKGRIYP